MPIATRKPTTAAVPVQEIDPVGMVIVDEIYKPASVNNRVEAPDSLLVYMDGLPWKLESYFAQVLNRDDDIREIDIETNAAHQQYREIKDYELRVQSELSSSYDVENSLTTVRGSSIAILISPNKYDYFVAMAGNQEPTLFMVTNSELKTYNTKSVCEIEYIMLGPIGSTEVVERYTALKQRTIATMVFVKDRIAQGLSPLLTIKDHGDSMDLREQVSILARYQMDLFWSTATRLLLVPNQTSAIFDARLNRFFHSVVEMRELPMLDKIEEVTMDRAPFLSKQSLWDAILGHNRDILLTTMNQVGIMPARHFSTNSYFSTTQCWSVNFFVYPSFSDDEFLKEAYSGKNHPNFDWSNLLDLPVRDTTALVSDPRNVYTSVSGDTFPVVKPVHTDGYYVFSKAFYKDELGGLSLLEIVVRDSMRGGTPNLEQLMGLVTAYRTWPALERFYYGPILIFLIKDAIRGYY